MYVSFTRSNMCEISSNLKYFENFDFLCFQSKIQKINETSQDYSLSRVNYLSLEESNENNQNNSTTKKYDDRKKYHSKINTFFPTLRI